MIAATTLAVGLMTSTPAQAADLLEKLPEQTIAVFTIKNLTELKTKFEASRYNEAWNSPELEKIRTTVGTQWQEFSGMAEEETGIAPAQLMSHFKGYLSAFALGSSFDEQGNLVGSYGIMAEIPAEAQDAVRADMDKLLAKAPTDATKEMETFRGVDIYRIKFTREIGVPDPASDTGAPLTRPFDIQYAFTDGHFLLVEGANDPLKSILTSMDDDATTTLGRAAGVQSVLAEVGGTGDTNLVVNFPHILNLVGMQPDAAEAVDVMNKLGLSEVGPAALAVSLTDYGMVEDFAMGIPTERKGLLAMLSAGDQLQLTTPAMAPADTSVFLAWTLDLQQLWDASVAMALEFSPEAKSYIDYGFLTAQSNFELDIQNDIIARVKGEHAFWMRPLPEEAPAATEEDAFDPGPVNPQVVFIGLSEGQQTADALNRLFRKLVTEEYGLPLVETDVRGTTVWTPAEDIAGEVPEEAAMGFSPRAILITSSMLDMQDTLRRLGGESGAPSISSDADFQRISAEFPKEWMRMYGFSGTGIYRDLDQQLDGLFLAFQMMAEGPLPIAREDIPNAEWFLKYFGPSAQGVYIKPDMIRTHKRSYVVK
jgi:hypothetical protein